MIHMIRLITNAILIVLLSLLISCGGDTGRKWRIGVSQCSNDDWRSEMNDEVYREMLFHEDAEVEIRSADDSNEKQIADIRYFIDNGFDLIIAAPNESEPITPIIKEAYDKGIPVITYDRDISGNYYTSHLEVDNTGLGKSAASYAMNIISPGSKIVEIQGIEGMSPTQKRHKGFMDEINAHPVFKIVASVHGDWDEEKTALLTDSILDIHPDVSLIFAHNDRMAVAASKVARSKNLNDIKVLGIDGSPEIGIKAVVDSVIDATFLYPTEGSRLVRTAMAILKGEPYDREYFIAPVSPVDRSNADILLQQNALQKGEIEKIRLLKGELDGFLARHATQTTLLYSVIAIVILLCGVFFMLLRTFWQHKRHQALLVSQNRLLAEQRDKQKELYQQLDNATKSKMMFYTNVSHDLRTPLTLIEEPVARLVAETNMPEEQRNRLLALANKNIKILSRLINQILDFRKYESGKMTPLLSEVKFAVMVKEWIDSFRAIARKHNIQLTEEISIDDNFTLALDAEKIERVFFNLMSNAFKYTPDNGKIHFFCSCNNGDLEFSVHDTGIGISKNDLPNVFERFYQADKVHPNGSGIGLALTKAFVELHDGNIKAESVPGEGSVFSVSIPVRHVYNDWEGPTIGIREKEIETELDKDEIKLENRPGDPLKPTILIIDDNEDIKKLITELLGDSYNILYAGEGKQGVRLAAKYVPDLIICDVMMPVMNGLECCKIIKQEISTSHIPVLMLTACSMDEQRVESYECGADGYLSKPFNGSMLAVRCSNLIENRKRIRDLYKDTTATGSRMRDSERANVKEMPGDIDSEFYTRFLKIVESELDNAELSVEWIASRMGLGQSQFSRKIKSLTNFTPVELIRTLRLKRARTLLTGTEKTMSEIAYEVGFTTPAYFSKCFRDAYGESPSDLRGRIGNGR